MSIITVNLKDLFNVVQYINMVRIKLENDDSWTIAPVLYSTEESLDILCERAKSWHSINVNEKVIIKFQQLGYEYLINGIISDIGQGSANSISIKYIAAQKCYNLRKFMRFDATLKASIISNDGKAVESKVSNISKGGVMLTTSIDLLIDIKTKIRITFDSGNFFTVTTQIIRKSITKEGVFIYGLQFVELSDYDTKIINTQISEYEREYLKSISMLRYYSNKSEKSYDTRVAIFSYEDIDESYAIREELIKAGVENYDFFYNFNFYVDYFTDEKPKIVFIDAGKIDTELNDFIININKDFPNKIIVLLLPIEFIEKSREIKSVQENVDIILYKPLIFDEFEQAIIKFL
jgi:hypothetical protein